MTRVHFQGEGTRLIHPGNELDPATRAVSLPIYQSVIYAQESVDRPGRWEYSRTANPTRAALEETIAVLEEGQYGFAFASGMAAIASVLCLFSSGDHLVVARDIYGGTFRLLHRLFPRFGLAVDFVDATDLSAIKKAVKPETKAIYLETPSNPLLRITDLAGAVALAREHRLLAIVDNTFMTPYWQKPLTLGADIVVHSATKYLAGHSDCLAGLAVVRDKALAEELAFIQNAWGAVLSPHDAWLVLRGIKTLKVRLEQQQETAWALATWLAEQPSVKAVYYPGLPDHPRREVHFRQARGAGAVIAFRLGSSEQAEKLVDSVRLPVIGSSLGAVESIISLPARMSHASLPAGLRQELGITPDLVRFSVGLEDAADLRADLAQALAKAARS